MNIFTRLNLPLALMLFACLLSALVSTANGNTGYLKPSDEICRIVNEPPITPAVFSPDHKQFVVGLRPSTSTLKTMRQAYRGLAGIKIDNNTKCEFRSSYYYASTVYSLREPSTNDLQNSKVTVRKVDLKVPSNGQFGSPTWTSNSKSIIFSNATSKGVSLWVANPETGKCQKLTKPVLSNVLSSLYHRTKNPDEFFVFLRTDSKNEKHGSKGKKHGSKDKKHDSKGKKHGSKGKKRQTLLPTTQKTSGKSSSGRTWQNLLNSPIDVERFKRIVGCQMAILNVNTGAMKKIGKPGFFCSPLISGDGQWLLIKELVEPFSYSVPYSRFPYNLKLINLNNHNKVITFNTQPLADSIPTGGVREGMRSVKWLPHTDNTLIWTKALDGGDSKKDAEVRDKIMTLSYPFTDEPTELFRTKDRCYSLVFTEKKGLVFPCEYNWKKRWVTVTMRQLLIKNSDKTTTVKSGKPTKLFSYSYNDEYNAPGNFIEILNRKGVKVVKIDSSPKGNFIYLSGKGATPDGYRPFLKSFNLKTFNTKEIFRCNDKSYESFQDFMYTEGGTEGIVNSYETPKIPANYVYRTLTVSDSSTSNPAINTKVAGKKHFITSRVNPSSRLNKIKKSILKYERSDGTPLSGLLCLPPDYKESEKKLPKNERRPVLIWAYPRSYSGKKTAGQVRRSDNVYSLPRPRSCQMALFEGYIVLDKAQMPVIGDPETMNDTFLEQITDGAKAAIDKLNAMNLIDPEKVAVGGHSYGAFMTANLLAHTDLFAAGIGRSGAYNRTLTPFGFQAESRNLWEATDTYIKVSPFLHADKINEPFLMIHGLSDSNSGTYPMQSKRMFSAIQSLGGTAKLVLLPYEGHSYKAKKSLLHMIAESINWLNKHVKNKN